MLSANTRIAGGLFILLLFCQGLCYAQITMPKVFGDNMVLQRDIKIPVWGSSDPGSNIIAELGGIRVTTKANKEGKWMVRFPKFEAGGPYILKVYEKGKSEESVTLHGVLIGDVWLASGQSNMEWQVQQSADAENEIVNADFSNIRFLSVAHNKKLIPQEDISSGEWQLCDSTYVKEFSAVAYFFARKIQQDQNVPVGIIQSTWGGTPVESWTSREMLLSSPISRQAVLANSTLRDPEDFIQDSLNVLRFWDIVLNPQNKTDKIVSAPDYDDSDWAGIEMPRMIKDFGIGSYEGLVWLRKKVSLPESFEGKDLIVNVGYPEMNYSLYFNGEEICKAVWNSNPTHHYTIPAHLVKRGENVVSIRLAAIWNGGGIYPPADNLYISDGSSQVSLAGSWLYHKDLEPALPKTMDYHYRPSLLFNAMINPLIPYGIKGFIWYQGEANASEAYHYRKLFPMLITDWRKRWNQGKLPFLYVQLANFRKTQDLPSESDWAELREAQTMTLTQPNTGMACIIDIGEADDIHPKNKQEVGRRLALIANKLVYKQKDCIASGPVYKSSKTEGNQIRISFDHIGTGLLANDGNELTGFAVAGHDRQFHWAKAKIEGNEVVVYSDLVKNPQVVRYAWANNPMCNLVNSEGLPAVPFRTDDWKGITQK
ncbi:sialate O-acetylesterase [Belliella marina]|uniref:Sialate O-acetylesterase n=1 Tax=Belliella marina TaxID=1644146 RepID=A0ABW4VJ74_9BACT